LIYYLTSASAFVVSLAILIWAARWLMVVFNRRSIAILGVGVVGVALSIIQDFTITFGIEHYDRTFQAVVERAAVGGVIAMVIGYFSIRNMLARTN
jgi:hypothetical protein